MYFRRVSIPVVLVLTLLLQFLPGTIFAPRPVAAVACDQAQFISDVTIPDGTSLAPGATFLKTWRLKNIGTCNWTTSYSAVFVSGDQMGAPAVINLPSNVAPGGTVDISANMTAPSSLGHYRGNWKLRNASGGLFGVGSSGTSIFWVDIFVSSSSSYGGVYDFVANYASATWSSGGSVQKVDAPQLENGSVGNPGLLVTPQNVAGGYIQGVYPAFAVQAGDRFQSIVNCAYNAPNCYVNFRLNYQIGSGPVQTLWSFNERYEGLYYRLNLDLSSLAGQNVNFILYMADVSGYGSPAGDQAMWVETKIVRSGVGPGPGPVPTTCDRGAFVADVTIPDGSTLAPGQAFVKTWEIRNVGSCTWTTDYALIFAFGTPMGTASVVNLPAAVASGVTADFSVNMVAPSTPGHYRSYWRFRNASGQQFGVGSGMITFFADIYVSGSAIPPALLPSTTLITLDSPDPSTIGGSVAVSATVSGTGGTPTGTVTITGADTNCTITLSGGSGSCNVVFSTAGAKTLSAMYNGSATYANSSDTESHTVGPVSGASSTTTITADNPDSSTPGASVAVSVTVSGTGTTPTGTVALSGADTNCTITLAGGSGNCNVVFNTAGAKTITAAYSGDGNYAVSSDTENHTVSKGSSTTTITADTPDPSDMGESVPVSVTVSGLGSTPSGTVAITGADTNCSITLSSGSGSCDVIFTSSGAKTLTATYSGDANFTGSADTEGHTVSSVFVSSTNITADTPDPSIPGQAVLVTVAVTGAGTIPNGTVAITGADTNCTVGLNAVTGTGSCSVTFNTTGVKTLTATYNGNANYAGSTDTESHNVGTGLSVSATNITSHIPDPSTPGQAVVVKVNVNGAGLPVPTGTVEITGADANCSILLLADGTGSCSATFNTTGHKTLTAEYSGDGHYASSSGTIGHIVIKGSTTITIWADNPDPSMPGAPVLVGFSVIGGGVTPTGTVDVTGADVNCSTPLSGGAGSCTVKFNTFGAKTITATYNGDDNYLPSVDTEPHQVKNTTTTVITSIFADPSTPGQTVTVNFTVSGDGATRPTGNVSITGADFPSPCTVVGIVADPIDISKSSGSCVVRFDTAGAKVLQATYDPLADPNYAGSTGWFNHTVNKGQSQTIINSIGPGPYLINHMVTVSVTVRNLLFFPLGAIPTGTVAITTSVPSSSCTLTLDATGTGQCDLSLPATVGTYTYTATYNGDQNYLGSVFSAAPIIVN